MKSTFN